MSYFCSHINLDSAPAAANRRIITSRSAQTNRWRRATSTASTTKKAIPNHPKFMPKMENAAVSLHAEQIFRTDTIDRMTPATAASQIHPEESRVARCVVLDGIFVAWFRIELTIFIVLKHPDSAKYTTHYYQRSSMSHFSASRDISRLHCV